MTLKFDRQALTRGIQAGIAAGNIDPQAPLELQLSFADRQLGGDTLRLR